MSPQGDIIKVARHKKFETASEVCGMASILSNIPTIRPHCGLNTMESLLPSLSALGLV